MAKPCATSVLLQTRSDLTMSSAWHWWRTTRPSWSSSSRRICGEERSNCSTGRISGTSPTPVFVCSGMGQQWWAMGRELLSEELVFRRAIEQVSDLFSPLAGWSLLEKLSADEQSSQRALLVSVNRRSSRCSRAGDAVAIMGRRTRRGPRS